MFCFERILKRNNLEKHDGRQIWKYKITDLEYSELKESVANGLINGTLLNNPEDAVLYVAEWWKNEYKGGKLSWYSILSHLKNITIENSSRDFQEACRVGLYALRIKVIQLREGVRIFV